MWIRSQDKETLTDVKHLSMRYLNGYYGIFTDNHLAPNEMCNLGMYKTKEKALKVLDLIQECIESNEHIKHVCHDYVYGSYKEVKVFQMPQDDEVKEDE